MLSLFVRTQHHMPYTSSLKAVQEGNLISSLRKVELAPNSVNALGCLWYTFQVGCQNLAENDDLLLLRLESLWHTLQDPIASKFTETGPRKPQHRRAYLPKSDLSNFLNTLRHSSGLSTQTLLLVGQ